MRKTAGRDWVLLDWTGQVKCPYHGLLDPAQEYAAGRAVCGCLFVTAPGGLLRAQKHDDSLSLAQHDVRAECENAG